MQNISGEIADCIVLGAYYIKAGNSVIDLGITVLILSLHSSRKKGTGKKKKDYVRNFVSFSEESIRRLSLNTTPLPPQQTSLNRTGSYGHA